MGQIQAASKEVLRLLTQSLFSRAAGKSHEPFDHIRQRLEIDFTKNLVSDLELVFHAPDGRAIDSVEYRASEWKKIVPGSLYELLQKTAEGAWRPDRFPADPELRLKLQEKLKEINAALEAFETASPEGKGHQETTGGPSDGFSETPLGELNGL